MSTKNISDDDMKILLKSQQGELDAVLMYNALAKTVKNPHDSETFKNLAADEGRHASVFHHLTGKTLKPKKGKAILLPILYRLIGKQKLYPLIAKGEYDAAAAYAPVAARFTEVESVLKDEKRHGDLVSSLLQ